jgi:hypothetical protein
VAEARQIRYHILDSMAIPYVPDANPNENKPYLVSGSNVTISHRGTLSRRPGFSTYTANDFGSGNTIERFFHWRNWAGTHFVFANVVTSSTSVVYKQQIGTDSTFQSLHTDSTSTQPFDFVIANNWVFFANGTDMQKYDGTNLRNWGITGPTAIDTPSNTSSGNVPAAIGHTWIFAYGASTTEHISDISPPSSEVTTASRRWGLGGARSTDAQVNRIHIYRTRDGGATYYELNGSPIANPGSGDWSHTDNEADVTLSSTQAPVATINDVPRAGYGPVFFVGRIWWFVNDTLYYTGFEEVNNGVFEESAPLDNERNLGAEITGLTVVSGFLLIFTRSGIFRISGDSLSTFRMDSLSQTGGIHNRTNVTSTGNVAAWLDIANVIRISNGVEIREISQPIRTDIESITHADAQIVFWDDGQRHWLVVMDGGGNALRIYDFDLDFWFPPWSITKPTGIYAGETANGTHRLFLGRTDGSTNQPLRMNTAAFQDDSVSYTASIYTGLFTVSQNPMGRGHLENVILTRNSVAPSTVVRLFDEDPSVTGDYTAITANSKAPPNRSQGSTLLETWYDDRAATGRRVAIGITWAAATTQFAVHDLNIGYNFSGGA